MVPGFRATVHGHVRQVGRAAIEADVRHRHLVAGKRRLGDDGAEPRDLGRRGVIVPEGQQQAPRIGLARGIHRQRVVDPDVVANPDGIVIGGVGFPLRRAGGRGRETAGVQPDAQMRGEGGADFLYQFTVERARDPARDGVVENGDERAFRRQQFAAGRPGEHLPAQVKGAEVPRGISGLEGRGNQQQSRSQDEGPSPLTKKRRPHGDCLPWSVSEVFGRFRSHYRLSAPVAIFLDERTRWICSRSLSRMNLQ